MWESNSKSDLVEGIARAERLTALLSSQAGDDIRAIITTVAQAWFDKVKNGDAGAHNGLVALDDFTRACDFTITLGEGMKMELVKRQGSDDGAYIRAAAE